MFWEKSESRNFPVMTALMMGCLISACQESGEKSDRAGSWRVVAGEPVAEAEWELFLNPERSAVFGYFHEKYGATDAPDFWTRDFHGERPMEVLRQRAGKNLLRVKVEQMLARQEGLQADISWEAFRIELERENQRRSQTLQAGGVVYGPTAMDERAFFQYRHSNMVIRLKEKLALNGLEPSEEDVTHAYDSLKTVGFYRDTAGSKGFIPYAEVRAVIRQQLLNVSYERKIGKLCRA